MPTDIILKLIKGNGCAHFPWEAVPESSPIITKTVLGVLVLGFGSTKFIFLIGLNSYLVQWLQRGLSNMRERDHSEL